jgi:ferredoxin
MASGAIAVQIAEGLRQLGWRAEAHIDANYKVICPFVARDAGLGEIGRMGLVMTPGLGPRVRFAVVTTDLPLVINESGADPSVLDFCSICEKCADMCPADAIVTGPRLDGDGALRWKINQEACFTYWCSIGTDCGQCIRVCPYSHPDTLMHNMVREGIRRSSRFRKVALVLDDFFYGRRPASQPSQKWLP